VRFTGGEPLMRVDLERIIASCAVSAPGVPFALTTNGIGLEHRARGLVEAGLTRVNISLDTLDREAFGALTRRDRLPAVLAGIRAAAASGLTPVKVNAVLMPGTLNGAGNLLQWCIDEGVELRFIEQMPLDADRDWARNQMVTARRLRKTLADRFDLKETNRNDPSDPAEKWTVNGGDSTVGIIAAVTRPFCSDCDRTRITAEGTVRSCLFSDREVDLRGPLRIGVDDEELASLWRGAMWDKPPGHGISADGFVPPDRSMGAIGG